MIPKSVLKSLIKRRLDDARALLNNRRYSSAIYLSGYAVELALKLRICRIMKFTNGFPETLAEFTLYYSDTSKTLLRGTIKELRDIRHHNLTVLLRYSGEQLSIESNFLTEWNYVKKWNPEIRYIYDIIKKQRSVEFIKNVRVVVKELL